MLQTPGLRGPGCPDRRGGIPKQIRMAGPLNLPAGRGEHQVLTELKAIAAQTRCSVRSSAWVLFRLHHAPVIFSGTFCENPGWYPNQQYQAEIQRPVEAL